MQKYIVKTGMKAKIFALVHDSILAEVPEDEVELYSKKVTRICTSRQRTIYTRRPYWV